MHKLTLYYFSTCPYCHFVNRVIKDLNLFVDYKNIHEDELAYEKLVKDTGRSTVPCLYVDGNPMHESSDIIDWLQANQSKLEKVGE